MDILGVKQKFGIIGGDEAMDRALEVALRVAPTDLSVLITGESGVGKEFFPQIIHAYSPRKHGSYIAVNCGAIPEGTIDSELFGHEKGSFTGATDNRQGYFEVANGGTIFLDEVGELPLTTQVRLLRILQTGEFIKVGSSKTQKTNVRVVAATNKNLAGAVAEGKFREDLYYRLNTVPVQVPALRNRKGDIYMLFRKFAADIAAQYHMPVISLDEGARRMLEGYYWPGNVRQLKNVAEQISAVEESRLIDSDTLKKYIPDFSPTSLPTVYSGGREREYTETSDRDLLYRVLFDMRADISDLKRMMLELSSGRGGERKAAESGPLLPVSLTPYISSGNDRNFEDTEIEEELPHEDMTKEKALRDAIIRSMKRHGGKRREVARELFMSERTLYRKLKELGIDGY